MKKNAVLIFIVILVACIGGIYVLKMHYRNELKAQEEHYKKLLEELTPPEENTTEQSILEEETTISTDVIKEKLQEIGYLCSEEYYFTQVAEYTSEMKDFFDFFSIPLTRSHFVCCYDGLITAGIDFDSITVEKNDNNKTIIITIPEATMKTPVIFEDSYKVYDENSSIFNPITTKDNNDVRKKIKENATQKAIDNKFLEKANDNAKKTIEQFANALIDSDDYKIEIKQIKNKEKK